MSHARDNASEQRCATGKLEELTKPFEQHVVEIADCNQLCHLDRRHANIANKARESARIFEHSFKIPY